MRLSFGAKRRVEFIHPVHDFIIIIIHLKFYFLSSLFLSCYSWFVYHHDHHIYEHQLQWLILKRMFISIYCIYSDRLIHSFSSNVFGLSRFQVFSL